MKEIFQRTERLIGTEAMEKLFRSRVAVFGLGGVGGYAVEALARSGIGALDLIDHDVISESNLNRQILATCDTIGRYKAEAAAERVSSIHPGCRVTVRTTFFLPENAEEFDFSAYDYVVDAIDTVAGKLAIIEKAKREGVPVISCMGTGNKMDPSAFCVADIYETSVCPLAKIMRKECRRRGIESLKVVYSAEEPLRPWRETPCAGDGNTGRAGAPGHARQIRDKDVPGSNSFTPAAAGLLLAAEVIKDMISFQK